MEYKELLSALSARIGADVNLEPDDSGAVVLQVDAMQLTILGLEEVGQVVLTGVVGEPPPVEGQERLFKALLTANYNFAGTSGATLSINPDDGKIALCRTLPMPLLDADGFCQDVEGFVNVLETWMNVVRDFRGTVDAAATGAKTGDAPHGSPASPAGASAFHPGFGGFMQV